MKKIVVISCSLRPHSNSEALAREFVRGATAAGHDVDLISLRGKKLAFCVGCFQCHELGHCAIEDDAVEIEKKVCNADAVVFASPIYYYGMPGQMKTLLDRMNSLYPKDYNFREVYYLCAATENEKETPAKAIAGVQGWVDCFEKAELKGTVFLGDATNIGDSDGRRELAEAYTMGYKA